MPTIVPSLASVTDPAVEPLHQLQVRGRPCRAPLVISELRGPRWRFPLPSRPRTITRSRGMLGLAPGQNLLVDRGHWNGPYIRHCIAHIRSCWRVRRPRCPLHRRDSGLIVGGTGGDPFFDEKGEPAKPVAEILSFLEHLNASRKATQHVCTVLKNMG